MNAFLKFIFIIIAATVISGCRTNSFLPQTQNIPLFTEKNQFQISNHASNRSLDLQLAYSATHHFAFIANGLLGNNENFIFGNANHGGAKMFEIGGGYYTKIKDKLFFESYIGIGDGYNNDVHSKLNERVNNSYRINYESNIKGGEVFIQPNLGIGLNDYLILAFSVKATYWNFTNYYYRYEHITYNGHNYPDVYENIIDLKNAQCYLLEPAITLKVGGKYVKGFLQAGAFFPLGYSPTKFNPYFDSKLLFRIGVTINMSFSKAKE